MNKKPTQFKGLYILENNYFNDDRGVFSEIWNQEKMLKNGLKNNFNQDNVSISKKNVIRGLHFQNQPHGQIKLVRVIKGKVLDVVVDIRKKSNTFGQYFSIELSEHNHLGLWIPEGFAHGFLSLEENSVFIYKCIGKYQPENEHTIHWNDPDLKIKWGIKNPIISTKDKNGISFNQYLTNNLLNR